MRTLDREKLDFVNKARSNPALRHWCGQFMSGFVVRLQSHLFRMKPPGIIPPAPFNTKP